ncbi:MAG: hypothetical protein E7624_06465 [Ruminococcaceae bacterium]|nr:hypothetical protein [Oscillospiraceae bacterium]
MMKKLSVNRRDGVLLIAALICAAVGVILSVFGKDAVFVPMKMAAWLHYGVAVLLVLDVLWPALIRLCERGAQKESTKRPIRAVLKWLLRWSNALGLVLFLAALGGMGYLYYAYSTFNGKIGVLGYLHVLMLVLAFAALMITSKAFLHFAGEEKGIGAVVSTLDVLRFNLAVLTVGTLLNVTGLFDLTVALRVIQFVMAAYCALFLLLSLISGFIRGECGKGVRFCVPRLFSRKLDDEEDLIAYLEKSTGITLRSLFGIRVIKTILPGVVLGVALFFWLSTGVVQVESYQQGALYRFGKCEKILEPGIHLTLPYPFDKVDIYDTERVGELIVGYESADRSNLLWTESHGGTEYKLLLGNGNELVSVNLRIKYKIDDLYEYVTVAGEAEQMLNAKAYAVVRDITVRTTLDELLAEDRTALSQTIEDRLAEYLEEMQCGLVVVDAILESFHPPVEVSTIYQEVVSAELLAQALKDSAEGMALATGISAELRKNALIQAATVRQNEQVAAATAAVAEFMAMLEAYEENPDTFCYYKYLDALAKVYAGQRLYIVSDGIDQRYIYFGNGVIVYNDGK